MDKKDRADAPSAKDKKPGNGVGLSGKDAEKLDRLSTSLRHVYQTAVEEDVPDSMMDLLKRLG